MAQGRGHQSGCPLLQVVCRPALSARPIEARRCHAKERPVPPVRQKRLPRVAVSADLTLGCFGGADDDGVVQKDSAAGVRGKLGRAHAHVAELEHDAKAFLISEPFKIYHEAETDSGPIRVRVHVRAEPPEHLGLILGDGLHNARTALDHVVCRLVEDGGGTVGPDTMFPTAVNPVSWPKQVKRRLAGASPAAVAAVMQTAAHPGGDDQLWALHRLVPRPRRLAL